MRMRAENRRWYFVKSPLGDSTVLESEAYWFNIVIAHQVQGITSVECLGQEDDYRKGVREG